MQGPFAASRSNSITVHKVSLNEMGWELLLHQNTGIFYGYNVAQFIQFSVFQNLLIKDEVYNS